MSLYEMSKKWKLRFGNFFGPFLGTVVENAKHKKIVASLGVHNPSPSWRQYFPHPILLQALLYNSLKTDAPVMHSP